MLIYSLLLFVWDFLSKPTFHCIEIVVLSDSLSKSIPSFQPNPHGRSILVTKKLGFTCKRPNSPTTLKSDVADFYWYLNHATGECEMKNAKTTAKSLLLPQPTESQVESNTKKAVIPYFSQSQLEQRAVAKVI